MTASASGPAPLPPNQERKRLPLDRNPATRDIPPPGSLLDENPGSTLSENQHRSRHESLITFSNHHYYDSKLVTFPAPETRSTAVTWQRVDGVWARGAEKTNAIEARAIVDEAVQRLRDPHFVDADGRPLTLAIITMNAEQMRLIEDLLDKARRSYPEIEPHFDTEQRLEPVVVRNLETAQGDERDVVLIGMSFGPTEPGGRTMSMNFGKLNAQGGWRRLNVAVTRARREMKVFTSFDPGMIDLTRTSQRAIADLKHFVEFAERGPRALAEADRGSLGGAESPFEEAVALELQRRGWTVVTQVGVSKFRIDIGVVHPDRPGDYLLGVECDGASYHSAATARDRDRVRAAILESLGWKLVRVWSTDWWVDRQRAAERLNLALVDHLEADRAATAQRAGDEAEAAPVTQAVPTEEVVAFVETPDELQAIDGPPPEDVEERLEPIISRQMTLDASTAPQGTNANYLYRRTDFSGLRSAIDPSAFYDPSYNGTLTSLIGRVLENEAPIAETLLVQRIARAHGFQRAGRLIRDRVMKLVSHHHHRSERDAEPFVWLNLEQRQSWTVARRPASDEDIRQIEEIALEELRAATVSEDPVGVARYFGVRRLSAAARSRISFCRQTSESLL